MANPKEGNKGMQEAYMTEENLSVLTDGTSAIDCSNCEYVEFQNQGTNAIYFTTDGTTPVAADGNGAQKLAGSSDVIVKVELGRNVASIKLDAATGATNLFYRLHS